MARAGELAGQVVVVTGAARGPGALVARRPAARDARVALLGLEADELARVSAACGPRSRWREADVTGQRALAGVAAAVREPMGGSMSSSPMPGSPPAPRSSTPAPAPSTG